MYINATLRNWFKRSRNTVTDLPAGLQVTITQVLAPAPDTVQIRVDRLVDAVRDASLTLDLAPTDASALAAAINVAVAKLYRDQPYRHPAEGGDPDHHPVA